MVIKQEVAYGIVESIANLRNEGDTEDFTVLVDGTRVRCHRFLLGACSQFFRALFRSGMKESHENCVSLKEVSHPTFTLILTALYTGLDVITSKNVIDLWHATNQLQIGFLVEECERFVIDNLSLDNYDEVYKHAKLLDSATVFKHVQALVIKNFDNFQTTPTFLELTFSEIHGMIKDDDLVATSEDIVIEAILKWASYSPENDTGFQMGQGDQERNSSMKIPSRSVTPLNQQRASSSTSLIRTRSGLQKSATSCNIREQEEISPTSRTQECLVKLLSAARLCLASPECLTMLLKHPLILQNHDTKDIIADAVSYHLLVGKRHGQWPTAAVHRHASEFDNVIAVAGNDIRVCSVHDRKEVLLPNPGFHYRERLSITAFDNELYVISPSRIYAYRRGVFTHILGGPGTLYRGGCNAPIALSHGEKIYIFNEIGDHFYNFSPKFEPLTLQSNQNPLSGISITTAASLSKTILVFGFEATKKETTAVYCFNPTTGKWRRLKNLQGPATNLVSFKDDKNTYILQANGAMWKVDENESGSTVVSYCVQLWDFHWDLYGTVLHRKVLNIYGGPQINGRHFLTLSVPGILDKLKFVVCNTNVSVTPLIMAKKWLQPQIT